LGVGERLPGVEQRIEVLAGGNDLGEDRNRIGGATFRHGKPAHGHLARSR
jgi:hypothetical protein